MYMSNCRSAYMTWGRIGKIFHLDNAMEINFEIPSNKVIFVVIMLIRFAL